MFHSVVIFYCFFFFFFGIVFFLVRDSDFVRIVSLHHNKHTIRQGVFCDDNLIIVLDIHIFICILIECDGIQKIFHSIPNGETPTSESTQHINTELNQAIP